MNELRIRKMVAEDEPYVFQFMRVFYDSPAVLHTSSDEILRRDIKDAISECPFLEGYVFEKNKELIGYAMVSLNYTTEYGGICIWVEDFYLIPEACNQGFSKMFFQFLEKEYPNAVRFKLEVEPENERAIAAYKKNGYGISHYYLMTKEV